MLVVFRLPDNKLEAVRASDVSRIAERPFGGSTVMVTKPGSWLEIMIEEDVISAAMRVNTALDGGEAPLPPENEPD